MTGFLQAMNEELVVLQDYLAKLDADPTQYTESFKELMDVRMEAFVGAKKHYQKYVAVMMKMGGRV